MGMSMTSDPQHHPMGNMNGLSYSHGNHITYTYPNIGLMRMNFISFDLSLLL